MSVNPPLQGGRRLPRRQYFDPDQITAIYENPVTGWRESVPNRAWLWMLLFTGFYMAARGLWRPLGLLLLVLFGTGFFFWPLLLIVAPACWILSAVKAQNIFRDHYMRLGWYEIDPWQQDDEERAKALIDYSWGYAGEISQRLANMRHRFTASSYSRPS